MTPTHPPPLVPASLLHPSSWLWPLADNSWLTRRRLTRTASSQRCVDFLLTRVFRTFLSTSQTLKFSVRRGRSTRGAVLGGKSSGSSMRDRRTDLCCSRVPKTFCSFLCLLTHKLPFFVSGQDGRALVRRPARHQVELQARGWRCLQLGKPPGPVRGPGLRR